MPELDVPTDIGRFVDRLPYSCSEPEFVHTRQEVLREWIMRMADAYENGWECLRIAALRRLAEGDVPRIHSALACLFVVGTRADVATIEPLSSHPDEAVRKAVRTCAFELRRRPE